MPSIVNFSSSWRLPFFDVPGQMIDAKRHFDVAHVGDELGIMDGLLVFGQALAHFILGHDMVVWAVEAHAVHVGHLLERLDTEQDLVRGIVVLAQVVTVARRHSLRANTLRDAAQDGKGALFLLDTVVLELYKVVLLAENALVLPGNPQRLLLVPPGGRLGNLSLEAGGQGDDPLVVLLQCFIVDTRLIVEALKVADRDDVAQVLISLEVLRQENQVVGKSRLLVLVEAAVRGHIDLAADDRLEPRILHLQVEVKHAVHIAMVGDGTRGLTHVLEAGHERIDLVHAVQQ
jgi:hypothetical protein